MFGKMLSDTTSIQTYQYEMSKTIALLMLERAQGESPPSCEKGMEDSAVSSIWLIDVNRQLPSVHLDGFDISVDQFPAKEWLPDNITLRRLDVLQPISEELKGKYDLVHVRLFLAVVQNYDPTPILRNLMDMLSQ